MTLSDVDTDIVKATFTTQRTCLPFSGTAVDQTIEQTLKKSCKTSGGMKGITLHPGMHCLQKLIYHRIIYEHKLLEKKHVAYVRKP